jgi:hypothetical protein
VDRRRIEAKAADLIDMVLDGGRVEDDLVELKSQFPPHRPAARRLAGHANAARSDPILWVIGLDEGRHVVTGADEGDIADWWPRVKRCFAEGVAPEITSVRVASPTGGSVIALGFTTDQSPYMVTTEGQGPSEREIPWREGTTTRSARRSEVLRILLPATETPTLEIVSIGVLAEQDKGWGSLEPVEGVEKPAHIQISVTASLYIEAAAHVTMPAHRWQCDLTIHGAADDFTCSLNANFYLPGEGLSSPALSARQPAPGPRGLIDVDNNSGINVSGPGRIHLRAGQAFGMELVDRLEHSTGAVLRLRLPLSQSDRVAKLDVDLLAAPTTSERHIAAYNQSGVAESYW